jgi:hypothetical protein
VYALRKLEYLLIGRRFTLLTDHKNLIYIDSETSQKVKRWKLSIQHFDCDIIHIPGQDNVVADGFSRFVTPTVQESSTLLQEDRLQWIKEDFYARY